MATITSLRSKMGRRDGFLAATDVVIFQLGDVPQAVGLGYKASRNPAPIITLMGQGLTALEMLESAIALRKTLLRKAYRRKQ